MSDLEVAELDKDMVSWLYAEAREAALNDPGYLLDMIDAMKRQRVYRKVVDEDL